MCPVTVILPYQIKTAHKGKPVRGNQFSSKNPKGLRLTYYHQVKFVINALKRKKPQ